VTLLAAVVAACASPTPTPSASSAGPQTTSPSSTGSLGVAPSTPGASGPSQAGAGQLWTAATVDLPASVTGQAGGTSGVFCSPCHSNQVDLLFGVAATGSGYIALGMQEPPSIAVAWSSTDGRSWSPISDFPASAGSVALAAAADGSRQVVVGGNAAGAASWASSDGGATWTAAPAATDLAGPHATAQMVAIVFWQGRFVAAGYRDDLSAAGPSAAIWLSNDGLTWQDVSEGAGLGAGRVYGLAVGPDGLVAVGTTGDPYRGEAAVWTSTDGTTWTRVESPAFAVGPMHALTAGGPGLVAVGTGKADDRAAVWTSTDGTTWQAAPDDPSFHHYGAPVRMASVTSSTNGLVVVGWRSDAANGSGVVWRSADGADWREDPDQVSLLGGDLSGVVAGRSLLVGVGTAGYPDNDQAAVWLARP
jgi:hypothetical protein